LIEVWVFVDFVFVHREAEATGWLPPLDHEGAPTIKKKAPEHQFHGKTLAAFSPAEWVVEDSGFSVKKYWQNKTTFGKPQAPASIRQVAAACQSHEKNTFHLVDFCPVAGGAPGAGNLRVFLFAYPRRHHGKRHGYSQ
jgi:hypothetical protein